MKARLNPAGMTLLEVIISTMLVGVVLVAALDTLGMATRSTIAAASLADGWALAELLTAEAMAQPYEDQDDSAVVAFGIESDETSSPSTREDFDDLDDYHLRNESPPTRRDGTAITGYTGWTAEFLVRLAEAAPDDGGVSAVGTDEGLKHLRVRVIDPGGEVYELDTLRSRHGVGMTEPALDLEIASGLRIDFTVDGAGGHAAPAMTIGLGGLNQPVTP